MDHSSERKTFKYKLIPTLAQKEGLERLLGRVPGLCRALSNTRVEQPITAYHRCYVSASRCQHETEFKSLCAAIAEYADLRSHVLQDALARLNKTYRAYFRRMQRGEKAGFL